MTEAKHKVSAVYPKARHAIAILLSQDKYDLSAAAAGAGLTLHQLKNYLGRPSVRAYLRNERRTQIEALCASNANALARVRDEAENSMAVVTAIRQAESMRARIIEEDGPTGLARPAAGLVIVIGGNGGGRDVLIEPASAPRIEDGAFLRKPDPDDDLLAGELDDEPLDVPPMPMRVVTKPRRRK